MVASIESQGGFPEAQETSHLQKKKQNLILVICFSLGYGPLF